MRPVGDIRLENLERLISASKKTVEAFAADVGASAVYLSQVRNRIKDAKTKRPREIGAKLARKLEEKCGKPSGWMDTDHNGGEHLSQKAMLLAREFDGRVTQERRDEVYANCMLLIAGLPLPGQLDDVREGQKPNAPGAPAPTPALQRDR